MKKNIHVYCHSPSLSLLLFETTSAQNDQVGLLLGSVQKHRVTCATDENEAADEEKTVLYIEHIVPLPNDAFDYFGESSLKVIENWCKPFKTCQIIGWFSFRWNQQKLRCSLRDNLIHKWLVQHLQSETLVVALLSGTTRHDQSTHSFRQLILHFNRRGRFESVPFKVCSLSDPLANIGGYFHSLALPQASQFTKLTEQLLPKASCFVSTNDMEKLQSDTCLELSKIGKKLLELETRRASAEKELMKLKKDSFLEVQVAQVQAYHADEKQVPRFLSFDSDKDYAGGRICPGPVPVSQADDQDIQMVSSPSNSSYHSCDQDASFQDSYFSEAPTKQNFDAKASSPKSPKTVDTTKNIQPLSPDAPSFSPSISFMQAILSSGSNHLQNESPVEKLPQATQSLEEQDTPAAINMDRGAHSSYATTAKHYVPRGRGRGRASICQKQSNFFNPSPPQAASFSPQPGSHVQRQVQTAPKGDNGGPPIFYQLESGLGSGNQNQSNNSVPSPPQAASLSPQPGSHEQWKVQAAHGGDNGGTLSPLPSYGGRGKPTHQNQSNISVPSTPKAASQQQQHQVTDANWEDNGGWISTERKKKKVTGNRQANRNN